MMLRADGNLLGVRFPPCVCVRSTHSSAKAHVCCGVGPWQHWVSYAMCMHGHSQAKYHCTQGHSTTFSALKRCLRYTVPLH